MGYYNQPAQITITELTDFEKLLRTLPVDRAIEALDMLETLSRNVIQHPSEDKYRRVRSTNEKLSVLFGTPGIFDVMADMGWCKEGEFMVLPKEARLDFPKHIVPILEAKSYFGKQRESAKKSGRMQQDPNKAGLLQQLEIDRRERAAGQLAKAAPAAAPAAAGYPAAAKAPPAVAPPVATSVVAQTTAPEQTPNTTVPGLKDKIAQIGEMGFSSTDAEAALLAHDGDVERSIEALCNGWTAPTAAPTTPAPVAVAKAVPVAGAVAASGAAVATAVVATEAANRPQAAQAKAATAKSAGAFERREDKEQKRKEADMSLQDLRALQKEKFKEFKDDPNAGKGAAYQRPASTTNGSQEAGWFDWMWGGSSSNSSGNGGGGGGGRPRQPPPGPRMKTISDLPKPCRPAGG